MPKIQISYILSLANSSYYFPIVDCMKSYIMAYSVFAFAE